jgi:hypothetical protein
MDYCSIVNKARKWDIGAKKELQDPIKSIYAIVSMETIVSLFFAFALNI